MDFLTLSNIPVTRKVAYTYGDLEDQVVTHVTANFDGNIEGKNVVIGHDQAWKLPALVQMKPRAIFTAHNIKDWDLHELVQVWPVQ